MIRTVALSALCLTLASLAACSSSGGSLPTCQGAGENSACDSCLMSKCSAYVSSFDSDCGDYGSCIEGCQCNDMSCFSRCKGILTAQCNAEFNSVGECLASTCRSACGAVP